LVRDLSIFQIGESQNRFGVHSYLGTNISTRTIRIIEEAIHAYTHHQNKTDDMLKVFHKRLILNMIDKLKHSVDGITCGLVKSDQTIVPRNDHLVNVIQYFELSISESMFILNVRLRMKAIRMR
jgi:hypothetical protein